MSNIRKVVTDLCRAGVSVSLDKEANLIVEGKCGNLNLEKLNNCRDELIRYMRALRCNRKFDYGSKTVLIEPSWGQVVWWHWAYQKGPFEPPQIHIVLRYRSVSLELAKYAMRRLVHNYDSLRSRFKFQTGELKVELNSVEEFPISIVNLSSMGMEEANSAASLLAKEFRNEPMRMDEQWLIRATLVQLPPDDVLFLIGLNHIIADGASCRILKSDLERLLFSPEKPAQPFMSFYEYSYAENRWLEGQDAKQLAEYWREWYRMAVPLRTKASDPLIWKEGKRVSHQFFIDKIHTQTLRHRIKEWKIIMAVIHMAVLFKSIAVWSGQAQFPARVLGDKRTKPEIANSVGFMFVADSIYIRDALSESIRALAREVQEEYFSAMQLRLPTLHVQAPHIIGANEIERGLSNKIAITVNFQSFPETITAEHTPDPAPWPPCITLPAEEVIMRKIAPIELQVRDLGSVISANFLFNEAVIERYDQQKIVNYYLDGLSEVFLTQLSF